MEILYKARAEYYDKWVYGVPVNHKVNTYDTDKYMMVEDCNVDELDYWQPSFEINVIIPETICRYTGITDRNNVKIFENDIVKTKYGRLCKVIWFSSPSYQGWDLVPVEFEHEKPSEYDLWDNLEVVGNVFDDYTE